ncbi:MAG: hypothetical protein OXB84_02070, partial [Halobacteriovoraceae bacterium]|nr:hypothetical protein [Halobacteriovoraceae bacterium]
KKGGKVISFYAPYYCKQKDREESVLLHNSDIKNGEPPKLKNTEGDDMDFDASKDQYFKFLRQVNKNL